MFFVVWSCLFCSVCRSDGKGFLCQLNWMAFIGGITSSGFDYIREMVKFYCNCDWIWSWFRVEVSCGKGFLYLEVSSGGDLTTCQRKLYQCAPVHHPHIHLLNQFLILDKSIKDPFFPLIRSENQPNHHSYPNPNMLSRLLNLSRKYWNSIRSRIEHSLHSIFMLLDLIFQ